VKGRRRAGVKRRSKRSTPTCVGPAGTLHLKIEDIVAEGDKVVDGCPSRARDRHLNRRPDRPVTGPPWPLVFPVLPFPSDPFRPPKYQEQRPSPRERPGNTKTDYLPARRPTPAQRWGFQRVLSGRGWGLSARDWRWVRQTSFSFLHYCGRLARRVGFCSCTVDSASRHSRSRMSHGTFASASKRSGRPMPGRRNPGR
jgi:hypothetical protein